MSRATRCGALLVAALTGCRAGADTPRGVAERFLDAHYVRIDLAGAREYCVGVARRKVEDEQRLVGDHQIDAATRRPHVSYRFEEQRDEEAERVSFLYGGTVRVDGGGEFDVRWLVTVRREGAGRWKVSNFQEFQ